MTNKEIQFWDIKGTIIPSCTCCADPLRISDGNRGQWITELVNADDDEWMTTCNTCQTENFIKRVPEDIREELSGHQESIDESHETINEMPEANSPLASEADVEFSEGKGELIRKGTPLSDGIAATDDLMEFLETAQLEEQVINKPTHNKPVTMSTQVKINKTAVRRLPWINDTVATVTKEYPFHTAGNTELTESHLNQGIEPYVRLFDTEGDVLVEDLALELYLAYIFIVPHLFETFFTGWQSLTDIPCTVSFKAKEYIHLENVRVIVPANIKHPVHDGYIAPLTGHILTDENQILSNTLVNVTDFFSDEQRNEIIASVRHGMIIN